MSTTSNILNEQNKNNSFKVPDGYFDDLSLKIQNKIQHSNENFAIGNKFIFNPLLAYGFGLVLILIMIFSLYKLSNTNSSIINLNNNEISELILNDEIELDDEQVADLYLSQIEDIEIITTENDGIYEYLNDEDLDEQTIFNEYN